MKDIENKIENVKNDSREFVDKLKHKAQDIGHAVKEQLKSSGRETLEKAADAKENVFKWVKSNPGKSVGIAFVLGWIFSKKIK